MQLEIQNQTLEHIGQELHDNVGQLLAVARLYLNTLEELTQQGETYDLTVNTNTVVDQAIADVRALSKSLDGNFLEEFGLIDTLTHELKRIQKARRIHVELTTTGAITTLGPQREIVLYRIIQEVLTNAFKHSEAKRILVVIAYHPSLVELSIQDDGKGFDYKAAMSSELSHSGAGLRNIERRAQLIGGSCTFITQPGIGTTVQINLSI